MNLVVCDLRKIFSKLLPQSKSLVFFFFFLCFITGDLIHLTLNFGRLHNFLSHKVNMDLTDAALGNLTATQRDQLMSEVKQQLAVANAQELLTVN